MESTAGVMLPWRITCGDLGISLDRRGTGITRAIGRDISLDTLGVAVMVGLGVSLDSRGAGDKAVDLEISLDTRGAGVRLLGVRVCEGAAGIPPVLMLNRGAVLSAPNPWLSAEGLAWASKDSRAAVALRLGVGIDCVDEDVSCLGGKLGRAGPSSGAPIRPLGIPRVEFSNMLKLRSSFICLFGSLLFPSIV